MDGVKRYDCSGTMCQSESGDWVCVEILQAAQSELAIWKTKACEAAEREAALREELATTKGELGSLLGRYSKMWDAHDKCAERLTAAEQRNADFQDAAIEVISNLGEFCCVLQSQSDVDYITGQLDKLATLIKPTESGAPRE